MSDSLEALSVPFIWGAVSFLIGVLVKPRGQIVYLWSFKGHFIQFLCVIFAIEIHGGGAWASYGFNLSNFAYSMMAISFFGGMFVLLALRRQAWLRLRNTNASVNNLIIKPIAKGFATFTWHDVLDMLMVIGFVPFAEESMFRGWLQTRLMDAKLSSIHDPNFVYVQPILIAALLFGAFHLANITQRSLPQVLLSCLIFTILGLFWGIMLAVTGSLLGPVVCHGIYNALSSLSNQSGFRKHASL